MVLNESALQINVTVMKNKAALVDLSNIMTRFTHKVNKFNGLVLATTHSLKKNGLSASDLFHQLFLAYLSCPDTKVHNYITSKQNKTEEVTQLK